jgi:hypothetical protein
MAISGQVIDPSGWRRSASKGHSNRHSAGNRYPDRARDIFIGLVAGRGSAGQRPVRHLAPPFGLLAIRAQKPRLTPDHFPPG